jgi:hypothetical protein
LDVSENALTGTIPESIGNWGEITTAYLNGAQFTGTMPNSICYAINVTIGDILTGDCAIVCDCCTKCS